ncbi:hypothetical protein FIBSPDRAFT_765742 [Athelia psychrophila]|uniref:Uncharacterized protein n=1 Tax=Athelia psychrophila TaxID=1759441 RepID=A0A167VZ30_9AGAM|nr:hypothetical protein FIBSPDRAFT_765742 [Fibularhizoctonia sp. CBS 109695]
MPDKRLLWHPRQENKFVVGGGSDITLYEWAPEKSEIRHVTSQHDLQFMKCFAWSPDPYFDDLIAIGQSTGRVDLIRLEATKQARNGSLSSGPTASLPVRNSRGCHALAFCDADPNYLAVGLDKVRGDSSLILWDIHSTVPLLTIPPHALRTPDDDLALRPHPRIPRQDLGPRIDGRVLQQHAPTENVSALAFLPGATSLLLAGISYRWLRLFDLRSTTPFTTNIASKVHGIATDPFDAHRIACWGDGTVTVWDARRLLSPLLTFTEKDAYADGARRRAHSVYTNVEFSRERRGTLAVMERDSPYVRFWDMQLAQLAETAFSGERSRDSSRSGTLAGRRSWTTNLPWASTAPSSGRATTPVEPAEPEQVLVLADTRRTRDFTRPLSSFALVPNSQTHPLTAQVMVLSDNGDLELYAVHDTPKHAPWSARGDLAIGAGTSYKIVPGFYETEPPPEPWDLLTSASHSQGHPPTRTESLARSDLAREESSIRGRSRYYSDSPAASTSRVGLGVGFGEEESAAASTNLAATKPGKSRAFSPASFRNYQYEHMAEPSGPHSEGIEVVGPSRGGTVDQLARGHRETSRARSRRSVAREKSASRVRKDARGIYRLVEEDISMIMRDRVIRGYGLSNPPLNMYVTQDDPFEDTTLSELWAWIKHSRELLLVPTPRLHGYDFSYQGLLGIWEGFQAQSHELATAAPTPRNGLLELPPATPGGIGAALGRHALSPSDDIHGDFHAAILALCARKGIERAAWKPPVHSQKVEQRQFALQLCGWSLRDEDLQNAIKKWEKEGNHSRAACWLVFTRQYSKAVELLMRSKDESHNMMSGTLAALVPIDGPSRNSDLRAQCERLIVRLQDPYFRAMLTHLALGDWSEVLEEEALPLRERLAIAFQFLEDKPLSSYLRRTAERSISSGDINGLIVTGLTPPGMDILQSYVDRTGDLQTAAILSAYVSPAKFADRRVTRWLDAYRDLLDGFKLFHYRVSFDIERGQIIQDAVQNGDVPLHEWAPRQILIRCHYCNKSVSMPGASTLGNATSCPHCNRALPRCSVCLMTLSIVPDDQRNYELMRLDDSHTLFADTIDDAIVLCQTCRHGGHASHILEWFFSEDGKQSHTTCPVADCDCHCAEEL